MIAKKKINIYDVARIANVSTATVSRVLNNKSSVSPETRRKVQEAIKQLNYRPSAIARGLVLSTPRLWGSLRQTSLLQTMPELPVPWKGNSFKLATMQSCVIPVAA